MVSELYGIITTIIGAVVAILSFGWWCIDVSHDPTNTNKRSVHPTSFIGVVVYIGEFLDTFVSQPLYISRANKNHDTSLSRLDRSTIDNVHLYLDRTESILIRPGFNVSIDISHKLSPVLRSLSNPILLSYIMMAGVFVLAIGLLILVGIFNIIAGAIVAITTVIIGFVIALMTASAYDRKDSLLYILNSVWYRRYFTIEIDCTSVRWPTQIGPPRFILKKLTPSLRFVHVTRDGVLGIGLVADEFLQTDVFIIHEDMKIDDLNQNIMPSLVDRLNDCLNKARTYTTIPLG